MLHALLFAAWLCVVPSSKTAEIEELYSDIRRQHWSLQSRDNPIPPTLNSMEDRQRIRTPIDNFILSKLRAQGLQLAPDAGRTTLIRRLYFDLLGLPPDPVQIANFFNDSAPDAYEKLFDQLLHGRVIQQIV